MKTVTINDAQIPAIGLGTWKMDDGTATDAVRTAIEVGYRHIDCAAIYLNDAEVGVALDDVIQRGIVQREDLWVTSKLWCNRHHPDHVESALKQSLTDLRLDYLDLYMIHWPVAFRHDLERPELGTDFIALAELPLIDTWKALENCVDAGLCKNLGVCNFNSTNLKGIIEGARIRPLINQVESHPFLGQSKLKAYCDSQNVQLVAYSPLGSGDRPERMRDDSDPNLFDDPAIEAVANKHGISQGQVMLAWQVNRGVATIPKSTNAQRLSDNLAAGETVLDEEDMQTINAIATQHRFVHGKFWEHPEGPYTAAGIWGDD